MAIQYSTLHRTNAMAQLNTDIGASCTIKIFTGSPPANCGVADSGTLLATFTGNAGGFGTTTQTLSGVTITGTAGQFSCTASTFPLVVGQTIILSGTYGGTGSITGYTNPTTYWITATNGSTTFTLSTAQNGSGVVTTTGTPTGITYTVETGILTASAITGVTASGTGTAGYFRIYPSASTTVNAVVQGTVATSAADMIVTNTSINSGQSLTFTSLTVTAFGA